VVERHRDHGLLDLGRALDLDRVLALRGVGEQQGLAGLDDVAGEPRPHPRAVEVGRAAVGRRQVALEPDRDQVVALADEDAAVVVVDQLAELVRDRRGDLAHVVRAIELADERLQELEVRDRADVLAGRVARLGPLGGRLVEEDDLVLAAGLGGHHRRLGAGDELARVRGVLRPVCDPDRERDPAGEVELDLLESLRQPRRERDGVRLVRRGEDDRELLAADPADDVARAHGRAQVVGELGEHLVAHGMPEDVVDLLEVVDVDHHDGDVLVRGRGERQLAPEALVEVTVVVEPRERVGLSLPLEASADVRVVERERRGVAEPLGELELLVAEGGVLADPVDVESALERAARDQRHDDQRLRLERRARHEAHARVEVRLVREHGLAVLDGPAGDPLAEGEPLAQDLVGVVAAHERGNELPLVLVGLVDVQGLVGDDLGERVRDPDEQRVEALLGEEVVEDVREPPVGVRRRLRLRSRRPRDEPHTRLRDLGGGTGEFIHDGAGTRGAAAGTLPESSAVSA
jgi:hypothetical protein